METWGAAITAVLTIILVALRGFQGRKAKQEATSDDTNIQTMRQALNAGDSNQVDAVLADQHDRIDRLLGPETGDSAGRQTDNRNGGAGGSALQ